jgi:hypothetical protein
MLKEDCKPHSQDTSIRNEAKILAAKCAKEREGWLERAHFLKVKQTPKKIGGIFCTSSRTFAFLAAKGFGFITRASKHLVQ